MDVLVLLRNVINGRLIGLPRAKADDLLQNSYSLETIKKPNWEEIPSSDPDFAKLCAIADGKEKPESADHSEHWPEAK